MDNEIDRKIDVTAKLFLLVQNRHQTHEVTMEIKLKSELEKYPKLNLTLTSEEIGRN